MNTGTRYSTHWARGLLIQLPLSDRLYRLRAKRSHTGFRGTIYIQATIPHKCFVFKNITVKDTGTSAR